VGARFHLHLPTVLYWHNEPPATGFAVAPRLSGSCKSMKRLALNRQLSIASMDETRRPLGLRRFHPGEAWGRQGSRAYAFGVSLSMIDKTHRI
jgi:hypothetical protein